MKLFGLPNGEMEATLLFWFGGLGCFCGGAALSATDFSVAGAVFITIGITCLLLVPIIAAVCSMMWRANEQLQTLKGVCEANRLLTDRCLRLERTLGESQYVGAAEPEQEG